MIRFDLSRRFVRVWQRNFVVYRKTWKIGFIPPLLEPLFYLVAFGVGLGVMVGRVSYAGNSIPYTTFIAPALIAVNIMQSAFFETTFASFVRMFYQKTFDGMLATPLSVDEVITGELLWGATKSAIGTFLMMLVISAFGLLHYPGALLLLPVAFLGGLAFACAGMVCTAIVPTIEVFNLPIFPLHYPNVPLQRHLLPSQQSPRLGTDCRPHPPSHSSRRTLSRRGPGWIPQQSSLFNPLPPPLDRLLLSSCHRSHAPPLS